MCISAALALRLLEVQAIRRETYIKKTDYAQQIKVEPLRGRIFDRDMEHLVLNKPTVSLGLNLNDVSNLDEAIAKLAPVLNQSQESLRRKANAGSPFIWLVRYAPDELVARVDALDIFGIQKVPEWRRSYPHGRLACHLLGFTGTDNIGRAGLEHTFNDELHGEPGLSIVYLDAVGKVYNKPEAPIKEARPGADLVLTINRFIQQICEEELSETIKKYNAAGGSVVVVQPYSGQILALACAPSYDPAEGSRYDPSYWRLRPITDAHEMGSVMKVVVFSAALEENLRSPEETIYCENGEYQLFDRTIEDHEKFGWLTVREVLIRSSNIGMAKIGTKIKNEIIRRYERDFGFGVLTGVQLQGESRGVVRKLSKWTSFTPAAMSYGYELSATPLQVAMAYAALANEGVLMKPKIIRAKIIDGKEDYSPSTPEPIRQVVSARTAETINEILQEVVQQGTGKNALIPGHKIAGKTGTARKAKIGSRGYIEGEYISSFAGYYPAICGEAEYCIYVMIDAPKGGFYASDVAAPTFKRILRRILQWQGEPKLFAPPEDAQELESGALKDYVTLPRFIDRSQGVAKEILKQLKLRVQYEGEGGYIAAQSPPPGSRVKVGSVVALQLREVDRNQNGSLLMPKIIGLTAREAINRLALLDIEAEVVGHGRVVHQTPEAGEQISRGDRCVLECKSNIGFANLGKW